MIHKRAAVMRIPVLLLLLTVSAVAAKPPTIATVGSPYCPRGNGLFILYYGGSLDSQTLKPSADAIVDMRRIWEAQPNFVVVANEFKQSSEVVALFHTSDATHQKVRVLSYVMMTMDDCSKRRHEKEIDDDSESAMATGYDGMFFDCTRQDTNQYSDIHDWNKARVQKVKSHGDKLVIMNPGESMVDSRVFEYADIVSVENDYNKKPTAYISESGVPPEKSKVAAIDSWRWLSVQGDPADKAAKNAKDALKRLNQFRSNGGFWYYSPAYRKGKPTHTLLPDWLEDFAKGVRALNACECNDVNGRSVSDVNQSTANARGAAIDKYELWTPPARLRGANFWYRVTKHRIDPTFDCEDIRALSAAGANYLNISHPGILAEKRSGESYAIEEAALNNLRQLVQCAESANMFVVVAYRTGPESHESRFKNDDHAPSKVFSDGVAQAGWREMWSRTAQMLKGNPAVVGYDLMVEPDTGGHAESWYGLAKQLINAIRQIDQDTPILIESADEGSIASLAKLSPSDFDPVGNRLVFAVHQYEPSEYSQQQEGQSYECPTLSDGKHSPKSDKYQPYTLAQRGALNQSYSRLSDWRDKQHVTVAVNEFGVVRWAGGWTNGKPVPDADEFMKDQLDLLEGLGVSNAIWKWDPRKCQGDDDYDFLHGQIFSVHQATSSKLKDIVLKYWQKNVIRPHAN